MKKLALPLMFVSMLFAVPAMAEESKATTPSLGSEAIPLAGDHDRLCREAMSLQESRIRDLRAAIEYDKKLEGELINGAKVRDADAATKERHASQWRELAGKNPAKANAFNAFATWLDGEARTDKNFANERRRAAEIIGKGWREAFEAIKGHEKFLSDLRAQCSG